MHGSSRGNQCKYVFSLKKDSRTRGHDITFIKDQFILDINKYSFVSTEDTIHEWNKLCTDCVNASSVNIFVKRGPYHVIQKNLMV